MKKMIIGFINDGTKIVISNDKVELEVTKNNIVKYDEEKIIVKNNNMISWMKWNEIEYFRF